MKKKTKIFEWDKWESKIRYKSLLFLDKTPTNQDVEDGAFIVVTYRGNQVWALFKCPCECGYVISLSLQKNNKSHWSVKKSKFDRPTLYPSVWQNKGCLSHFWITDGRVLWCSNTGKEPSPYKRFRDKL